MQLIGEFLTKSKTRELEEDPYKVKKTIRTLIKHNENVENINLKLYIYYNIILN